MVESINYWLLLPEIWVITGMVLITLELLVGAAYFLLALGVAALIFAIVAYLQEGKYIHLVTDWMDISILYALLALIALFLLKVFVQDKATRNDINKY